MSGQRKYYEIRAAAFAPILNTLAEDGAEIVATHFEPSQTWSTREYIRPHTDYPDGYRSETHHRSSVAIIVCRAELATIERIRAKYNVTVPDDSCSERSPERPW